MIDHNSTSNFLLNLNVEIAQQFWWNYVFRFCIKDFCIKEARTLIMRHDQVEFNCLSTLTRAS